MSPAAAAAPLTHCVYSSVFLDKFSLANRNMFADASLLLLLIQLDERESDYYVHLGLQVVYMNVFFSRDHKR